MSFQLEIDPYAVFNQHKPIDQSKDNNPNKQRQPAFDDKYGKNERIKRRNSMLAAY